MSKIYLAALITVPLFACLHEEKTTTSVPQGVDRDVQELYENVKHAGFDLVYPLTTGFNVGQIFEIRETADTTAFRRTLCKDAFILPPDTDFNEERLILATVSSSSEANFSFFAGISERLLKDIAAAKSSLSANKIQSVTVGFNDLRSYELPARYLPDGTRRSINPICELNLIDSTNADGSFRHPTFVVVGSLRSTDLSFEFDLASAADFDIELSVKSLFRIEPIVTLNASRNKLLAILSSDGEQFTIGGRAIALSHAEILDEVSNELSVVLKPADLATIDPAVALRITER